MIHRRIVVVDVTGLIPLLLKSLEANHPSGLALVVPYRSSVGQPAECWTQCWACSDSEDARRGCGQTAGPNLLPRLHLIPGCVHCIRWDLPLPASSPHEEAGARRTRRPRVKASRVATHAQYQRAPRSWSREIARRACWLDVDFEQTQLLYGYVYSADKGGHMAVGLGTSARLPKQGKIWRRSTFESHGDPTNRKDGQGREDCDERWELADDLTFVSTIFLTFFFYNQLSECGLGRVPLPIRLRSCSTPRIEVLCTNSRYVVVIIKTKNGRDDQHRVSKAGC